MCGQNTPTQRRGASTGPTVPHCAPLSRIPGALINPSYFWHIETEHVWAREVQRTVGNNTMREQTGSFVQTHSAIHIHNTQSDYWERGVYTRGGERRPHMEAINASSWCVIGTADTRCLARVWVHNRGATLSIRRNYFPSFCLTSVPRQIWASLLKLLPAFSRLWKMQESLPRNVSGMALVVHDQC